MPAHLSSILYLFLFITLCFSCKRDTTQETLEDDKIRVYLQQSGYSTASIDSAKHKSGAYIIFDQVDANCWGSNYCQTLLDSNEISLGSWCHLLCQDGCSRTCVNSLIEIKYSIYDLTTLSAAGITIQNLLADYPSIDSLQSLSILPLESNYNKTNEEYLNEELPGAMQVGLLQYAQFTKGSSAIILAPSHLAYGIDGQSGTNYLGDSIVIQPNSTIVYYLELVEVHNTY